MQALPLPPPIGSFCPPPHAAGKGHRLNPLVPAKISKLRSTAMDKTESDLPLSIEAAARKLGCDRRTLDRALRESARVDFIFPQDRKGVRGTPRWSLRDACESLAIHAVRMGPADERPYSEAFEQALAEALSKPCPRCGGRHVELPIIAQIPT